MALSATARDKIKQALPKPALYLIRRRSLSREHSHDRRKFLRFSSSVAPDQTQKNLAAWLTMLYHNLEKGLSLPEPRPGFGEAAVARLVGYLQTYIDLYGVDEVAGFALAALDGYVDFNTTAGLKPADIPSYDSVTELLTRHGVRGGGAKTVRREEVDVARSGVDLDFFLTRSSVRQFDSSPVDTDDIKFAVRAAQKSPAVCNRQFSRVYVTTDRALIDRALTLQGGARGFGDAVPALAVVTTSARSYWNAGERMQPWTDGGMFAMSFVLGLHSRGLGSVCLNWSKTAVADSAFRREFAIENDEVIVMLVGFGRLPETYRVAVSPRIGIDHTLHALTYRPQALRGGTSA